MKRISWRWAVAVVVPAMLLASNVIASAQGGASNVSSESIGIRLEQPTTPSVVQQKEAIASAQVRLGETVAAQASKVTAKHVLYTDEEYYTEDSAGNQKLKHYKVPAWVVTFQGVKYPIGRGPGREHLTASEVHVVISAETGEAIGLYTYR